jgi:N-acetylmuramoyl-L-alanine amidase
LTRLRSNRLVKASSYFVIFGLVIGLVYNGHATDSVVVAERQTATEVSDRVTTSAPSLDQVAASHLAANLASGVDLPIATNVANQAISLTAKSELAQTSNDLISKPQIVQPTTTASHGLTVYKAKAGDTVDSVAAQFKLTKNTIKWSNDLQSDALEPGRELTIPPVDGLIYNAQPGDTAATLAQKYSTDAQRIILFNDLELSDTIVPGTRVVIPGGVIVAAPAVTNNNGASGRSQATNITAFSATGNGYDYGYCTWYAYNRRAALGKPISGGWGNASSWASLARMNGFAVNSTPSVGAVMQDSYLAGGYGHVAVVESVNADGSIFVSEMNYGGWNVKSTRTIPASQVGSYNYIH